MRAETSGVFACLLRMGPVVSGQAITSQGSVQMTAQPSAVFLRAARVAASIVSV